MFIAGNRRVEVLVLHQEAMTGKLLLENGILLLQKNMVMWLLIR